MILNPHQECLWADSVGTEGYHANGNAVMLRRSLLCRESYVEHQPIVLSEDGNMALSIRCNLAGGHVLFVYVSHLEPESASARRAQVQTLLDHHDAAMRVLPRDTPSSTLWGGDFNCG
jgi:endonuclease/exonuclease/phosphatase family metal-dependent hydrolase